MLAAALAGFLLALSLILPIGAQNAFVLRQGLRREHVLAVVLTCAASDAVLIAAGVAGFGALVAAAPWLAPLMRFGGAIFLLFYGFKSLCAAWKHPGAMDPAGGDSKPLGRTLIMCLAFTWLNPHVYLDTVVLLGSIAASYGALRVAFGMGAACGSMLFFFSLGYGARLLRPLFARPSAWRMLDAAIGLTMLALAAKVALGI